MTIVVRKKVLWLVIGCAIGIGGTVGITGLMGTPQFVAWLSMQTWAKQAWVASLSGLTFTEGEQQKMESIAEAIEQRYVGTVDRTKLITGAMDGMVNALDDPYSEYLDKEELKSFQEHVQSSFSGIGAEVSNKDGDIVIMSPIRKSPAERAGLRPGDIVVSVNGKELRGMTLNEAVQHLRGPKGTQAKLIIQRVGVSKPLEVVIVRDDIRIETVESSMPARAIGMLRISQFSSNTADRFLSELAKLEKTPLRGLIIDVRNNPGGIVQAVETIANALVPKGKPILHIEYRKEERVDTNATGSGKPYPIVVLINEGSASASEILAAALKESAGATLVGKKTFGKGLVQASIPLRDGTAIKLTIAKWLTPNGKMIHKEGIAPDIDVAQNALFEATSIGKDKTYAFDMVSPDIENAQRILQALGFAIKRTDGYFDNATAAAVKALQSRNGLKATGNIDKGTATKLEELVLKAYADPKNDAQLVAAIAALEQKAK
ncbi:MAG: peptidoglycan-binding protein [Paenibacillaceae bacterium]|nr:peptidoglycan-binding protein [Paenibacillaceae bacterium]